MNDGVWFKNDDEQASTNFDVYWAYHNLPADGVEENRGISSF